MGEIILDILSGQKTARYGRRLLLSLLLLVNTFVCGYAQQAGGEPTLSLSGNYSIEEIFKQVQSQMGLTVTYEYSMVTRQQKIRVNFKKATLKEVMELVLRDQPAGWVLVKGQVLLFENKDKVLARREAETVTINGSIIDPEGNPIYGASLMIKGTSKGARTDSAGRFRIAAAPVKGILEITSVGFLARQFRLEGERYLPFVLWPSITQMEPITIVSTGYQDLPKEQSTGSFVYIDSALVQRSVGMNILDRLDGVTSGLLSYRPSDANSVSKMPTGVPLGISLRGLSTLSPNKVNTNPLVILDNFSYEGDIRNINPNDIESISVLKDAASAGIWGARSGNGVIVLTTKKGKYGQKMSTSFNTNLTFVNKPDLYANRNFMSARDYIEVETELFNKGYFNSDLNNRTSRPPVSPAVEILAKQRDGLITTEEAERQLNVLRSNDLRQDMRKYLYQQGVNQQYQVNFKGGTNNLAYFLSLGYDRQRDNLVRNGNNRFTITSNNIYRPFKKLEISAYINYGQRRINQHNELGYGNLFVSSGKYAQLYPYARLADDGGSPLSVMKGYRTNYLDSMSSLGLLDWKSRPLDEIYETKKYIDVKDLLLRASVRYSIFPFLIFDAHFQNEGQDIMSKTYRSEQSFAARDLINRFTVLDRQTGQLTYNFPFGGLLNLGDYDWNVNSLRASLSYKQRFNKHWVSGIIGAEIRELSANGTERGAIGYSDEFGTVATNINVNTLYPVQPAGQSTINAAFPLDERVLGLLNRFVSYYAAGGYSYKNKYDFSASVRKDGANLFGAKTNQKLIPLWSAGVGWNIHKEKFYAVPWMENLRIRLSYGYNGNSFNGSAYTTGTKFVDPLTGAPSIINLVPANEELRWEKVRITNIGTDFSLLKRRLTGTIEFFRKEGLDLVEQVQLLPQLGNGLAYINTSRTLTKGLDVTLSAGVMSKGLNWSITYLGSVVRDEVVKTNTNLSAQLPVISRDPLSITRVEGRPLRSVFGYKWAGLDTKTGEPQGYLNGSISKNYTAIRQVQAPDSLTFHGASVPTIFGALRNDFAYKDFRLSVNVTYKLGYYFRKPALKLSYQEILNTGMNVDYSRRWKEPGDEVNSNTPSVGFSQNTDKSWFYQFSDALIERGDHIRLQDVRLGYVVPLAKKSSIKGIEIYSYLKNLGVLWRANKARLDPDMYGLPFDNVLPEPFSASFGIQVSL